MKPLIRVNSCLISPPSALAFDFALLSSSGEAFSLRVTCEVEEGVSDGMEWRGYVEGREKRVRTYVVHRHFEE